MTKLPSPFRKAFNMGGLILGFGFGQGSLFLSQTHLVAQNNLRSLAEFGASFTILVLLYQVIDFGGVVILARDASRSIEKRVEAWKLYWSLSLGRFMIALGVIAICFFTDSKLHTFASGYFLAGSIGLLAFATNPGGLLDGMGLSAITGCTSALPIVASAAALLILGKSPTAHAGVLLGAAYSAGAFLTVGFQSIAVYILERPIARPTFNAARLRRTMAEGFIYLLAWTPGQLFYRGQIVLCTLFLGPAPTAIFVYSKQIINAGNQFLFFARRVEFPTLVNRLTAEGSGVVKEGFSVQLWGLWLALIGTCGTMVLGVIGATILHGSFERAGLAIVFFAPSILTGAVFASLTQICAAMRTLSLSAWTTNLMVFAGLPFAALLASRLGLGGIAIGEVVMQLVGSAALSGLLSQRYKVSS